MSESDEGQVAAINSWLKLETGDIIRWLNSDDYLLPGCLMEVARNYSIGSIIHGKCLKLSDDACWLSEARPKQCDLELSCNICQPSAFTCSSVFRTVGSLNEDYNLVFDWDWFIRAKRANTRFIEVNKWFSVYRIHDTNKTVIGGEKRLKEILTMYETYHGSEFYDYCVLYLSLRPQIIWILRLLSNLKLIILKTYH